MHIWHKPDNDMVPSDLGTVTHEFLPVFMNSSFFFLFFFIFYFLCYRECTELFEHLSILLDVCSPPSHSHQVITRNPWGGPQMMARA